MSAMAVWPDLVFEPRASVDVRLVSGTGRQLPLDRARWHESPSGADMSVLERVSDPVLDVGCGPGRHARELAERGHDALGIDSSRAAVRTATRSGARAVHGCIFDPVPRAGEWATILLLDGNIGIGGSPEGLLARCHELLGFSGRVLVELDPPGSPSWRERVRVVVHNEDGDPGGPTGIEWFDWATVPASSIPLIARRAGMRVIEQWQHGDRWFAELAGGLTVSTGCDDRDQIGCPPCASG
jgi:SAM-dependent methyltransferase